MTLDQALDIPDGTLVEATERVPADWEDAEGHLTREPLHLVGPLESRIVRGWNYVNYYVNGITIIPESVHRVTMAEAARTTWVRDKIGRFASTSGSGDGGGDSGGGDTSGGGGGGGSSADAGYSAARQAQIDFHAQTTLEGLSGADSSIDGADALAAPGAHKAIAASGKGGEDSDIAWEADDVATSWNHNSGDFPAQDLMSAATRRTGIPTADWVTPESDRTFVAGSEPFKNRQAACDALLDGNAKLLKKDFPDPNAQVTLYRGTNTDFKGATSAHLNSLSSWTTNKYMAAQFGSGDVIRTTVPVTKIAGVPKYGLGNGAHSEVVLYGGKVDIGIEYASNDAYRKLQTT